MKIFRTRSAAALAIAAALSLSTTPAMARGWGHRGHHDRVDGGDVLAGLLVIGGIAAIATAASSNNRESREVDDYRYPDADGSNRDYRDQESYSEPVPNYRAPTPAPSYDDPAPSYGETAPSYGEATPREDDAAETNDGQGYGSRSESLQGAVDDCVGEIERGNRQVDSVDTVNREADGWNVSGRAGGRAFACSVDRDGRIRSATVDGAPLY